jgi:hypothetical protein
MIPEDKNTLTTRKRSTRQLLTDTTWHLTLPFYILQYKGSGAAKFNQDCSIFNFSFVGALGSRCVFCKVYTCAIFWIRKGKNNNKMNLGTNKRNTRHNCRFRLCISLLSVSNKQVLSTFLKKNNLIIL